MIDWDFETRLIDRIAARELIAAARLDPRDRRCLIGCYRHGETLRECGEREGVSPEPVRQRIARAFRRIHAVPIDRPRPVPEPTVRAPTMRAVRRVWNTPPPGFDKAAFLRHMQGLIARNLDDALKTFERERAALDDLIEGEQPPPPHPQPPPIPWTTAQLQLWPPPPPPKPVPPPTLWVYPPKPPQVQAVEPWFDPSRMPTLEGMQQIAAYALDFLVLMRRATVREPLPGGLRRIGTLTKQILCRRDADAIATEVGGFARGLPYQARLSAVPVSEPKGWGVTLATSVAAVRVVSVHNGQNVLIDITWDP